MSEARAECEALMNAAFPFAEQMLSKFGEFLPYGMVLTAFDEYTGTAVGGFDSPDPPSSTDAIATINDGFRRRATRRELKATALVYNVRVVVPTTGLTSDAVAFALDHRDGYSVVIFVPYEVRAGSPSFGEPIAQRGEGMIFRKSKRPWWYAFLDR